MDDRIKESHLEFVTDLTKEDTQLISDNSYFYRICQNLIENALKYSAKGNACLCENEAFAVGRKRGSMAGSNKHIGISDGFYKRRYYRKGLQEEIRQEPETETDLDWRS